MTPPMTSTSPPLPTLKIGNITIPHPFVQAALSGYSDWAMRKLAREHGASYTLDEVMLERFVNEVKGTGRTAHVFKMTADDHPVCGQLMGSDPDAFPSAALRLVDVGFDVIDINFGCPVKSAIGGCRGGYHLSQPDVALEIVKRVRDSVPDHIPVTLKMRRGIDLSEKSRDQFFEILDGAFSYGVAAITVHGRTVVQKYKGPSDWGFLKEVKRHAGEHTILGSGDLFTPQACVAMIRETGVNGVTIARGAIGNPWIFQQCLQLWAGETNLSPPTLHQQRDVLKRHRELIEMSVPPDRWMNVLRKFGFKYAKLHPLAAEYRAAWSKIRSHADWCEFLDRFYGADGPGCWPDSNEIERETDPESC